MDAKGRTRFRKKKKVEIEILKLRLFAHSVVAGERTLAKAKNVNMANKKCKFASKWQKQTT